MEGTVGRKVLAALACVLALALVPTPAAAQYLDPGASSVIVQVIIAGLIGVAAVLRLYWGRLKAFFASRRKPSAGAPTDQQDR
jgi:hypothetical protein